MKLVLLLICVLRPVYGYSPYVRTSEGDLLGTKYKLPNGREVLAFLGIPYAASPIGRDRFKEPKPPVPWDGVRPAVTMGNECLQITFQAFFSREKHLEMVGDEDCLFINVYTPKIPNDTDNGDDLMNVMVYIHKGGFTFESGNDPPDHILQHGDLVFVSFNYRIGPLGFLSFGDGMAPGNNGLKDQVEALRWVQRNIRQFGGNPAKVTIYGVSAGAASVHYQMLSPLTKGLFSSAITSSGSVSLPWSLHPSTIQHSKELASALNCGFDQKSIALECLRNKPAIDIINAAFRKYAQNGHLIDFPFGPVIEPPHHGAFLPENPYTLMRRGKIKHIPWLISTAENEGAMFGLDMISNKTRINQVNDHWNDIIPILFKYGHLRSKEKQDYISAAIRCHYFRNENLSEKTIPQYFRALGDRHFTNGIIETAKLYSTVSFASTYCYKFYYKGTDGPSTVVTPNHGSLHAEDSMYILKSFNDKYKTKNDMDVAKLLSLSYIAFMKTGNPNIPELEVDWLPLSKNGPMNCLEIFSYTAKRMEDIENHNTSSFWNSVLPAENYE